jgi:predicted AlkP superfamily phosphohydrolase/phosphomutase
VSTLGTPRLALLGIDAAEFAYIQNHLGQLPNLRSALERGSNHELYSQFEVYPGSVWPSFFTGRTVGEHGFYHIMAWDAAAMRLRRVTPDWLRLEPFWRYLGRGGLRTITVDVPMTHVPISGPGVEIAGWGTHQTLTDCSVYPASLKHELEARFGKDPLGSDVPAVRNLRERERVKGRLVASAVRKGELGKWLIASEDWDLLILVFGEVHRAGHVLWPTGESINPNWLLEVYQAVDRAIGEVLAALKLEDTIVAIFALHGMGPNHSQDQFTAKILSAINQKTVLGLNGVQRTRQRVLRSGLDRLPRNVLARLKRSLPRSARDRILNHYYVGGQQWSRVPAFALKSELNGYIRMNLRGRERDGALEAERPETRAYVEQIRRGFESFRHECGRPLVSQVFLADDVALGGKRANLPDLSICWSDELPPAKAINSPLYGSITADPDRWRVGHHRGRGFLAVMQPRTHPRLECPLQLRVSALPGIIRRWLSAS